MVRNHLRCSAAHSASRRHSVGLAGTVCNRIPPVVPPDEQSPTCRSAIGRATLYPADEGSRGAWPPGAGNLRLRLMDSSVDAMTPLIDPTNDTAAEADAVQLACIRRMSPGERLQAGCRMSQRGRRLAFDAIRVRCPNADDMEIRLRFIELAYGADLAADVRRWLPDRAI